MASDHDHRSSRDAWVAFRRLLARELPDDADKVQVLVEAGHATVSGEVGSEAAKAWVGHQVRGLPGVERVTNSLVVAAPLAPATGWDPFDDPRPSRLDASAGDLPREGTSVVRHPAIDVDGEAAPGSRITMRFDLRQERDGATDADPVAITDLDPDWERVDVQVEVHSASINFDAGLNRGVVVVRRGRTSIPFVLEATVDAGVRLDRIEVMAVYTHDGRFSGIARRWIAVARPLTAAVPSSLAGTSERPGTAIPTPDAASSAADDAVAPATLGWVAVGLQAQAPTLTLQILRAAEGDNSRYLWHSATSVRVGPANRTGYLTLGEEGAEFARRLRSEVARLRPGQHEAALRGFGQEIWGLAPRAFQDLYWALRGEVGPDFPIQIVTDEPHVPWELMQPFDDETGVEADHLFLEHPVARWIGSAEGYLSQSLPSGSIASFAPTYAESAFELPFAADEAAWLCAELDAVACEPERAAFLDLLRDGWVHGPVAAVHFAGHGSFDGTTGSGLLMNDGWVTHTEVGQTGNRIGMRFHSLAILNACDVGASMHSLGTMSGWAAALARRRFGGFVAPLWPVSDRHASDVVRTILRSLYRDQGTLGQAVRTGRLKGCRQSATPFAYVCYGDVMARITRGA